MSTMISLKNALAIFDTKFINIPTNVIFKYDNDILYSNDEDKEICSTWITNLNESHVFILKDILPELNLKYSNFLQNWILLIDFAGSSWADVYLDINEKSIYFEKLFNKDSGNSKFLHKLN